MAASKADEAVLHIIRQMQSDSRLAYLLGRGSRSYELLIEALAERTGENVEELSKRLSSTMKPVRVVFADDAEAA